MGYEARRLLLQQASESEGEGDMNLTKLSSDIDWVTAVVWLSVVTAMVLFWAAMTALAVATLT